MRLQLSGRILVLACVLAPSVGVAAEDVASLNAYLSFLSTFDDTTDVNLFGWDNDAGWIYTAESTRRKKVLVQNRCQAVTIAKGEGRFGDCLRFGRRTEKVLFYQASPNLPDPRHGWSGTVAFWLKPRLEVSHKEDCYPLQLTDGDWRHGGFFVRFPARDRATFELGAVGCLDKEELHAAEPEATPGARCSLVSVKKSPLAENRWTHVLFTFSGVNPVGQAVSIVRLHLDGKPVGQIRKTLNLRWMHPGTPADERDAVMFLGIDYVGDLDDLRVYRRILRDPEIRLLQGPTE